MKKQVYKVYIQYIGGGWLWIPISATNEYVVINESIRRSGCTKHSIDKIKIYLNEMLIMNYQPFAD